MITVSRLTMHVFIQRLPAFFILLFLANPGAALSVHHWESLVRADNQWSYFVGTSEPPGNWNTLDFDVSAWPVGKGGFGYGDDDDATVISATPSVYLRCSFQVPDPSKIVAATLFVDFDDGFVAYLNGEEIARANLGTPGTRPAYNQYADSWDFEAQLPAGGIPASFALTADHLKKLKAGENLLALQVHNCNATSSDLSSTTFLIGGISVGGTFFQPLPSWFVIPESGESHLPLIVINTNGQTIPSEPKITAGIRVIDNGPGTTNRTTDPGNQFDGVAGIEVRGQSSQMFPKKSYGIELRNSSGEEIQVSLLGMPMESDWILYAPYSDKTMLRNAVTYSLGGRMGRYQPRFRFCEVYLNGSYAGVYQLTERIKRDDDRVDISKLTSTDIAGFAVTGGYIVKVDKTQDLTSSDYFVSTPDISFPNSRNYAWSWYYPKPEDLAQEQKSWFMDYIKKVENSINSSSFTSTLSGYPRYLDTPSFIDYQIMNELANNVDGYRYSTFFYKNRDSMGGKLVAGPLWDFDLCYGNVDYAPDRYATNKWLYTSYGPNEGYCMHWWYRLMQDPGYVTAVKQRWSRLRQQFLHTDSVINYIDGQALLLGDAVGRNFNRWQILDIYVWPNSAVRNTYSAEISFLKDWIRRRLTWMDSQWLVPVTGIPENPSDRISLYPNPFAGILNITLPAGLDDFSLEMYDVRGVKVLSRDEVSPPGSMYRTDLSGLHDGLYILRIYSRGRVISTEKILKTK